MIGVFTYVDIALIAMVAVSAIVAMFRGLTRELLSIVSWAAAGAAVFYFTLNHRALAEEVAKQFSNPVQSSYIIVAQVALGGLLFLIVLVVVHLMTSRISDTVLDSRIGAIDRILGLAFGAARGFLIVVVVLLFYDWFYAGKEEHQHQAVRNAVFRPYIQATGKSLYSMFVRLVPSKLMGPGEQQQG